MNNILDMISQIKIRLSNKDQLNIATLSEFSEQMKILELEKEYRLLNSQYSKLLHEARIVSESNTVEAKLERLNKVRTEIEELYYKLIDTNNISIDTLDKKSIKNIKVDLLEIYNDITLFTIINIMGNYGVSRIFKMRENRIIKLYCSSKDGLFLEKKLTQKLNYLEAKKIITSIKIKHYNNKGYFKAYTLTIYGVEIFKNIFSKVPSISEVNFLKEKNNDLREAFFVTDSKYFLQRKRYNPVYITDKTTIITKRKGQLSPVLCLVEPLNDDELVRKIKKLSKKHNEIKILTSSKTNMDIIIIQLKRILSNNNNFHKLNITISIFEILEHKYLWFNLTNEH